MVDPFQDYLTTIRIRETAKKIYERCLEHGRSKDICDKTAHEFVESDTDIFFIEAIKELIKGERMGRIDKKYMEILTEVAAYNGMEIPKQVGYILYAFLKKGGETAMKKVLQPIFEQLEEAYKYLKSKDYRSLDIVLDNAKRQISELYNLLYPPYESSSDVFKKLEHTKIASNQRDIIVETIMQKIAEYNRSPSLEDLLQIARQTVNKEKSKYYR